jgi:NADPH:quinone reductase
VVDFAADGLDARLLAANGGRPVDRVVEVEFGLNIEAVARALRPRGRIVTYGSALRQRPELPFYPLLFKGARLEFMLVYLLEGRERAAAVGHLHRALAEGALAVPLHARFPLREVAGAHRAVEAGRRSGAVIVELVPAG